MDNLIEEIGYVNRTARVFRTTYERDAYVSLCGNRLCYWGSRLRKNKGNAETLRERKTIDAFSSGSAYRMGRFLRGCQAQYTGFVTLTYPSDRISAKKAKRDIKVFIQRVQRLYVDKSRISGFWFVEFQRNGNPHFHLFVDQWIDRKLLSKIWYEVTGSLSADHLKSGTKIETIRGGRHGMISYARKYAQKQCQKEIPEGSDWNGRFWGKFGNVSLVACTVSEIEFDDNMRFMGKNGFFSQESLLKAVIKGDVRMFKGVIESTGVEFLILECKEWGSIRKMQQVFIDLGWLETGYQRGWRVGKA
jgi:hypothetical protein